MKTTLARDVISRLLCSDRKITLCYWYTRRQSIHKHSPSIRIFFECRCVRRSAAVKHSPVTNKTLLLNFAGYHRAMCTNRLTWRPQRQVAWCLFRRRSWATQPLSRRLRSSTSTRTQRRPPRPTPARPTTSPRRIRTPPQPRLVRVWVQSRARAVVATIRLTITNNNRTNNSKTVL